MNIETTKTSRHVNKYGINFYMTCDADEGKKIHEALEAEGFTCANVCEGKYTLVLGYSVSPAGILSGLMQPSHYLSVSTIKPRDENVDDLMDSLAEGTERELDAINMGEAA